MIIRNGVASTMSVTTGSLGQVIIPGAAGPSCAFLLMVTTKLHPAKRVSYDEFFVNRFGRFSKLVAYQRRVLVLLPPNSLFHSSTFDPYKTAQNLFATVLPN